MNDTDRIYDRALEMSNKLKSDVIETKEATINELRAEIERLRAALKSADVIVDSHVADNERLKTDIRVLDAKLTRAEADNERLKDYKRKYLFLRSLAKCETRAYEEPPYAWTIRFRSSMATAENAIKQALEQADD